jgi:hypothetical protein
VIKSRIPPSLHIIVLKSKTHPSIHIIVIKYKTQKCGIQLTSGKTDMFLLVTRKWLKLSSILKMRIISNL